jgi:hypothetical protein
LARGRGRIFKESRYSLETQQAWPLDAHLIETVRKLESKGMGFRSLTEGVDTTTPDGTLVFHIFSALAQFERDLIREHTSAGLKAAEARGHKGGRRPVVTPDKLARARTHLAAGLTVREAAARVKVGKTVLYKALNGSAGLAEGRPPSLRTLVANSGLAICSRASATGGLTSATVTRTLAATRMPSGSGAAEFTTSVPSFDGPPGFVCPSIPDPY